VKLKLSSLAVGLEFQGSTRRTCKRTYSNQPSTIGGTAAAIRFILDEYFCMPVLDRTEANWRALRSHIF